MMTSTALESTDLLTFPFLDGWHLAAEGAAVFPDERTAVIADVHLGYEWARADGGDVVPPHSLAETLAALGSLFQHADIRRLIVAGDLVETPRPCLRTARSVKALLAWLKDRDVSLTWLQGDHDPRAGRPESVAVGGWTIAHGSRPIAGDRHIFGHLHPALRASGISVPCFLVGPSTIALPAFSPNAAGLPVVGARLPSVVGEGVRVVAGDGLGLLDFGPLATLGARLRGG